MHNGSWRNAIMATSLLIPSVFAAFLLVFTTKYYCSYKLASICTVLLNGFLDPTVLTRERVKTL